MLSYDISLDDMDCISYCDNSMYVLPPKTELNSSLFIENEDISKNNGKRFTKSNLSQRKISNNVDIPTYKGFSIANGYSTNNNKKTHNSILKSDSYNVLPEKGHLSRKIHLSSGKLNSKIEFPTKNYINTKQKIKPKSFEHLNNEKIDRNHQKNVRRVETFLGDKNYINHSKSLSNPLISKPNEIKTEKSPLDKINRKQIKEYIENKKRKEIKQSNENKLIERQKREKIEERLKLLSERTKTNDKIPRSKIRTVKETINLEIQENMPNYSETVSKNHYKRAADKSESDSDNSSYAVKQKLAKWSPLSNDEIETYRLASKHYMTTAINTNQKTDNILSNIIRISDKMALAKEELFKIENPRAKLDNWQPLSVEDWELYRMRISGNHDLDRLSSYSSHNERNTVTESNSITSSCYDGFEGNENYTSGTNRFANKNDRNKIKKDIAPTILANRALRKLDMDIHSENKIENDDSDNSVSAYSDLVERLIEEKKRRYEKSVEVNEKVMLLPIKSHPKRITNIVKGSIIRHHEIIRTVETDSLTFMKTYLKSKNKTTFDIHNSSTLNTNNSRIIFDELRTNKHSRSHSHQSTNIEDDDSLRTRGSPVREPTIYGRMNSDSESQRSLSVEKIYEKIRESNAFSEVEVTIENSSYSDQVGTQQIHEISSDPVDYNNFEARLSPNSLAKKFSIELHHYDGIHANMEQLLQSDRFQGIGFAQQETVSLAQILKARQWKDNQESENKQLIQQFVNAITNLNNNQVKNKHKRLASSSSETSVSSTAETPSANFPRNNRVNSTTESEASEIEEEIVDFSNSPESQFDYPSNHSSSNHLNNKIKTITSDIQSKENNKFITSKRSNKKDLKTPVKIIEVNPIKSVITESIKEVSTAKSISQSSSDVTEKVISEESIAESIETQSVHEKSTINEESIHSDISTNSNTEVSSARTVKTDSNFISSEKSPKEISTTDSIKSEIKSKSVTSYSNKKSNSKSALSTTAEISSTIKSENNTTNYSKEDFESNSDRQKSTSESDVIIRVNLLKDEKQKKQKLLEKLQRKLSIVKQRQKEKNLRNHINYLDSQIDTLQSELNNPNLSSSSLLLSPISKPHKHIIAKEIKILPTINRKSSTSSSSSVSKDEEGKSVTISISSSTLTSDIAKDASFNNKNDIKKPDEIDTPRSSKQIQFEDINEEYSASNRDSSELKTPSERTHISKEITENGTVKSKSENFHILSLGKPQEDEEESIANENEDLKIFSARTIHSEISEIPMEDDDLSGQEIDNDYFDKAEEESEKNNKTSCNQDFYSEDFSEVLSQKNSLNLNNTSQAEINEISNNVEIISSVSSEESTETSKSNKSYQSSESIPPQIPLRRRKLQSNKVSDDYSQLEQIPVENSVFAIDRICDELFNTFLTDIIKENESNTKFHRVSDSAETGEDEEGVNVTKDAPEIVDDSLVEELKDMQYDLLDNLIPWKDENILPLINIAIEELFHARQSRTGTLSEAFANCCENLPSKFIDKNSSAEKIHIYHIWQVNESLASSNIQVKQPYIPRLAIFHLVLEIMERIYEFDDQPNPVPWMEDAFYISKNRKLILWEKSEAPNSIELLVKIVNKQLMSLNILSGPPHSSVNRTRQHKWFHKQTDDVVDRLLIDETLQEDFMWQNYDAALETTIFTLVDEINNRIIDEIAENVDQ